MARRDLLQVRQSSRRHAVGRRPDCTMENFYTSLLYSMNAIPLSLAFASRRGGQAALDLLLQHLQLALHLVPLLQLRATIAIDVTQIALLRSGKGRGGRTSTGRSISPLISPPGPSVISAESGSLSPFGCSLACRLANRETGLS